MVFVIEELLRMVRKWKTLRVFISSTFRDTHFERDALTRLVFPELRAWCKSRYFDIAEIDLRWGVTEAEAASGKALQICLDETDRSDIFLCFIGSRYGWVPDEYLVGDAERFAWVNENHEAQSVSITELEINKAVFNQGEQRACKIKDAFFYFRENDQFLTSLESNQKELANFMDGEMSQMAQSGGSLKFIPDEEKMKKLNKLKQKIVAKQTGQTDNFEFSVKVRDVYEPLYHHDGKLSSVNPKLLRKFCAMVLQDLKTAIDERFPFVEEDDKQEMSNVEIEREHHNDFVSSRLDTIRVRKSQVTQILEYVKSNSISDKPSEPMILFGKAGMGKSVVISQACHEFIEQVEKSKRRCIILKYFVGASPGSLQHINMVRTLIEDLRDLVKHMKPKTRSEHLWSALRKSVKEKKQETKEIDDVSKAVTLAGRLQQKMISKKRAGDATGTPGSYLDLAELFKKELIEACKLSKVVLFIDNLEYYSTVDKSFPSALRWLPSELPHSLRLIVTLDEGVRHDAKPANSPGSPLRETIGFMTSFELRFNKCIKVPVVPLSQEAQIMFTASKLGSHGKRLDELQMEKLLGHSSSCNPSWLGMACEELRVYDNFEGFNNHIDQLANNMDGLTNQVLKRLELDHGPYFVRNSFTLLFCSRGGLFERELLQILGVAQTAWLRLFYAIHHILDHKPVLGTEEKLLSFSTQPHVQRAIMQRYFSGIGSSFVDTLSEEIPDGDSQLTATHILLAGYFRKVAYDEEKREWRKNQSRAQWCLTYHQQQARWHKSLEETITDLSFIETLYMGGRGSTWIDDLQNATVALESAYLDQQREVVPELPGFLNEPGIAHPVNAEKLITPTMISRMRDYVAFAFEFGSELVTSPHLVFQYACNLPDSNTASINARKLWEHSNSGKPSWLRWVNKPQTPGPCLSTLCGHTSAVTCCDISRDDEFIGSGSDDGTCRIWVTANAETHMVLTGHYDRVTAIKFSPKDAEILVTTSRDGVAMVWNKGTFASSFNGHKGIGLTCAAFSECGSMVVTGDLEGRILVWHPSDLNVLYENKTLCAAIKNCCFDNSGRFLFAAVEDRTIRAWSLDSGVQYMCKSGDGLGFGTVGVNAAEIVHYSLRTTSAKLKICNAKTVNPNLAQPSVMIAPGSEFCAPETYDLYSEDDETSLDQPRIRKHEQAQSVLEHEMAPCVTECAIARNYRVAAGGNDGSVSIFNTKSGRKVSHLHGHIGAVNALCYSHTGGLLITASEDHQLKIWNPSLANRNGLLPHRSEITTCTFSQGAKSLSLISASREGNIRFWNTATGSSTELSKSAVKRRSIKSCSFTTSGKCYVIIGDNVEVFSCVKRDWSRMVPQSSIGFWDLSPCEALFLCTEASTTIMHIWNISQRISQLVISMNDTHAKQITHCSFSKDGASVYTASHDGLLKVWDTANLIKLKMIHDDDKKPILVLRDERECGLASLINGVHESPDGTCVLTTSDSPDVKFWDLKAALTGDEPHVATVHGNTNLVSSCAWSPNMMYFATGSDTGSVIIFSTETKQIFQCMEDVHAQSIKRIIFTPDGRRVVTISNDKRLVISSVFGGGHINSMKFSSGVGTVAISPSGKYLAAGDAFGDLRILEIVSTIPSENASQVHDEEFPVVCPQRYLKIGSFGSNKWTSKPKGVCAHCSADMGVNGHTVDIIQRAELERIHKGRMLEPHLDLKFLNRCVHCKLVVRFAPFMLDRQDFLSGKASLPTQEGDLLHDSFYTNCGYKIVSFKANMNRNLPKLVTNMAKPASQTQDLLAKHLHALTIQETAKAGRRYATFEPQQSSNTSLHSPSTKFDNASGSELQIQQRIFEDKQRNELRKSASDHVISPVRGESKSPLPKWVLSKNRPETSSIVRDDKYLELEGPAIRRCYTASNGNNRGTGNPKDYKVLKSTTDFRMHENLFDMSHGVSRGNQLTAIQNTTPCNLQVSPMNIKFGVLCEYSTYRYPVKLLSKSCSLVRFRSTAEITATRAADATVSVLRSGETNNIAHGLSTTLYIELKTKHTGSLSGVLNISSNSGHLFTIPIKASVVSGADFASSYQKSMSTTGKSVTHQAVIAMGTSLRNV